MRKKVFIFINALHAGGAEREVSLLLQKLQYTHDTTLVLFTNIIEYSLPENQKIISLDQPLSENGILTILKLPILAWRYKRYCKKNKVDISFSFLKRTNYVNCLSRLFGNKAKIILSELAYLSEYLKLMTPAERFVAKYFTKRLYPLAHLVVPNAEMIKIDLEKNFNIHTNYTVINSPVDLNMINQLSKIEVDISGKNVFTFINVAGFRPQKNHELLIEAFNKVRHLPVRLLLLGKGALEETIRNKVNAMDLGSLVIFLGFDSNPFKYLAKSDCFVLSSDFEGFPNCLLESMACAVPIISTDCLSGPREILAPNTDLTTSLTDHVEIAEYGIMVPVNNAQLLADAIALMATDKKLHEEMKTKALLRAKDYDIEKVIDQFEELLSKY
jgi:N-acetylgalactosamine-N,N'-diacetylbacillosaminyl-diphospho-undecaprenol 4-alpha-N-acetylgalactosaminyltransferase